MQLERIDVLNKRLADYYGVDTVTGQPMWRIVYSEDQFEKRLTDRTREGLQLLTPVMVELPKYRQWIHNKYILENLVIVPESQAHELTTKTSYEPIHVFEDKNGNPLPPKWEACEFAIACINAVKGKSSMAKYKEGLKDKNNAEGVNARVNDLMEQLFGNETSVTDALAHQTGVTVPHNFERSKE